MLFFKDNFTFLQKCFFTNKTNGLTDMFIKGKEYFKQLLVN